VPAEIFDSGPLQSRVPALGADLDDRLPPKGEDVRWMLAELFLNRQDRLAV
jgi:hypothetical protein